jgi:hypothetical protein
VSLPANSFAVFATNTTTAVDDIIADAPDADAQYYNLQGIRVPAPTAPGLYIRRSGTRTTKILK